MCTSSEIAVTTNSIKTVRPSTIVPTVKVTPPFSHQVIVLVTARTPTFSSFSSPSSAKADSSAPMATVGPAASSTGSSTTRAASAPTPSLRESFAASTWPIHCTPVNTDSANATPTAAMPTSAPLNGRRFPKNRITKNDSAGMAAMIQTFSRNQPEASKKVDGPSAARATESNMSALHEVDFGEVDAALVAEDEQHDGEADTDLGRRDRDDEQSEHLTGDVAVEGREGDQVDVDGVEDQLDGHEDEHAVATGEHAVHTDAEQHRAQQQELDEEHGAYSFLATTMAPMSAASSNTEVASNATM